MRAVIEKNLPKSVLLIVKINNPIAPIIPIIPIIPILYLPEKPLFRANSLQLQKNFVTL